MDDTIKKKLNELYDFHCFMLTERGTVYPMYFVVKDKMITPILISEGTEMSFSNYTVETMKIASDIKADAMVLISEQDVVSGKASDKDIQSLLDGSIRPSEHPDKEEYLILTFMDKSGNKSALYGKIELDARGTKFIREQQWTQEQEMKKVPWETWG